MPYAKKKQHPEAGCCFCLRKSEAAFSADQQSDQQRAREKQGKAEDQNGGLIAGAGERGNGEEDRILKWEHDMLDELEEQIKVLRKSIQTAERDSRNATNVEEKLKAERKVDELKRKRRRLRNELDDREDEIGDKRKKMIAEIEKKMVQNVNNEDIFLIRWQIN